jgi:hypothetical protein
MSSPHYFHFQTKQRRRSVPPEWKRIHAARRQSARGQRGGAASPHRRHTERRGRGAVTHWHPSAAGIQLLVRRLYNLSYESSSKWPVPVQREVRRAGGSCKGKTGRRRAAGLNPHRQQVRQTHPRPRPPNDKPDAINPHLYILNPTCSRFGTYCTFDR